MWGVIGGVLSKHANDDADEFWGATIMKIYSFKAAADTLTPSLNSVSPISFPADTSNHTMQLYGSNFHSGDTLSTLKSNSLRKTRRGSVRPYSVVGIKPPSGVIIRDDTSGSLS